MEKQRRTGIIGGSGLYHIEGVEIMDSLAIDTPTAAPPMSCCWRASAGMRWCSCPGTGATTASRRTGSTTAPMSMP